MKMPEVLEQNNNSRIVSLPEPESASLFQPLAEKMAQQNIYLLTYEYLVQNPATWSALREQGVQIERNFAQAMNGLACDPRALSTVEEFCSFLNHYYLACDEDMLRSLAELYRETAREEVVATSSRFYEFVSDALYCYIGLCC